MPPSESCSASFRHSPASSGAEALRNLLDSAHYSDKKGMAAVVGIVTLMVGATSVFGELQHALDVIWGSAGHASAMRAGGRSCAPRLLSFGMVLGVGFLLLVSLIASAALAAFGGWLEARFAGLPIVLPAARRDVELRR